MTYRTRSLTLLLALFLVLAVAPATSTASTTDLLDDVADALGGDALAGLESFEAVASGTFWTLDEGPYPGSGAGAPGPYATTATFDLTVDAQRLDTEMVSYFFFARTLAQVVTPDGGFVDGQDNNFGPPFVAPMLSDRWAATRLHQRLMYPQLLLQDAMADPGSVEIAGNTLVFDTGGEPLTLQVDPSSGLPVRVSTIESDPLRRDVSVVVRYSRWRHVDGVAFPMVVTVEYDGAVVQHETRSSVAINVSPDPALFAFPAGIVPVFDADLALRGVVRHQMIQSFAALGFPRDGVQPFVAGTEIAPGVYFLAGGSHNSLAVVQESGVTIVEAPLDEVRIAGIRDWVETNIGLPITYVVASHHHTDHTAGVRQLVAAGAAAVVHEEAEHFFGTVFRARSTLIPDGMGEGPWPPVVVTVPAGGSYEIADAVNPVGIHTIESEHASDLVLVEVGGVLFVVDIYNPGLPLTPEADPIIPRVLELGLEIDTIAGGHAGTISWDDFVALFP